LLSLTHTQKRTRTRSRTQTQPGALAAWKYAAEFFRFFFWRPRFVSLFAFIHFASFEMCTRMINERKFLLFFPRFFAPLSLANSFTHFASNWKALFWKFRGRSTQKKKENIYYHFAKLKSMLKKNTNIINK